MPYTPTRAKHEGIMKEMKLSSSRHATDCDTGRGASRGLHSYRDKKTHHFSRQSPVFSLEKTSM